MKTYAVRGATAESPEASALWDAGCLGIWEAEDEGGPVLLAYFEDERPLPVAGDWQETPAVDHVAEYFATLGPVRVGHLVIAPSHVTVELGDGDKAVWLDPGSAFGTGHHETTRMALAALTRLDLAGKVVLDVGAGTGVLAIAADLLGALRAIGVDVDPLTIPVARENADRNRSRARFALGSIEAAGVPSTVDVVVANLYAELHASLMPAYVAHLGSGGSIVLTGILASLRDVVLDAVPSSMRVAREEQDGEWLLLELAGAAVAGRGADEGAQASRAPGSNGRPGGAP
ncbi:MAG: 50S ribosomal protein L11 methyltransferase [Trueperaceae bacterium]